jgi:hypothetical protein
VSSIVCASTLFAPAKYYNNKSCNPSPPEEARGFPRCRQTLPSRVLFQKLKLNLLTSSIFAYTSRPFYSQSYLALSRPGPASGGGQLSGRILKNFPFVTRLINRTKIHFRRGLKIFAWASFSFSLRDLVKPRSDPANTFLMLISQSIAILMILLYTVFQISR